MADLRQKKRPAMPRVTSQAKLAKQGFLTGRYFFGLSAADGDNSAFGAGAASLGGAGAGAASAGVGAASAAGAAVVLQQGSHFGLQPNENSFRQFNLGSDNFGKQDDCEQQLLQSPA